MFVHIMLAITITIIFDIILAITMIMREGGGGNKLQLVSWFSQGEEKDSYFLLSSHPLLEQEDLHHCYFYPYFHSYFLYLTSSSAIRSSSSNSSSTCSWILTQGQNYYCRKKYQIPSAILSWPFSHLPLSWSYQIILLLIFEFFSHLGVFPPQKMFYSQLDVEEKTITNHKLQITKMSFFYLDVPSSACQGEDNNNNNNRATTTQKPEMRGRSTMQTSRMITVVMIVMMMAMMMRKRIMTVRMFNLPSPS